MGEKLPREKFSDFLIFQDIEEHLRSNYSDITDGEIEKVFLELKSITRINSIYDANRKFMNMLSEGFYIERDNPSLPPLFVYLLNFEGKNNFKVVNQLEIHGEEVRIPDAIIYINGIPLILMEFKSAIKENATIEDAYTQITVRYKRSIPDIFKFNAFIVISDGANSKAGSFFAPYEYLYAWRRINYNKSDADGIGALITMIKGLFNKQILLDVLKDFIYFPDTPKNCEKIVCRYPQYFASKLLLNNIKLHLHKEDGTGDGKGGTYFGATGCGKSYTMLFLVRLLMKSKELASPTIVLITDRTDLDDQLSEIFENAKSFIGDQNIKSAKSREELRSLLSNQKSGGVFLTTIQKFTEDTKLLSDRKNIICISDEAHRSQTNLEQKINVKESGVFKKYGFAKYLRDSLPNATYVGFSGTPIDATEEVFGKIIDEYTMGESVDDNITVNILYEGRAAKVILDNKKLLEIEEYYKKCAEDGANEHQIEESKKASACLDVILGDPQRLQKIAEDFVQHYETRVNENSTVDGKAMIVCSNRRIAFDLYKKIVSLRPEWLDKKRSENDDELSEEERQKLIEIEKIKIVMTRDKDDEKELYDMLGTSDDRKILDKQFKNPKSNFKIVIVVDMWITGFDVPCLDTMYIDKPVKAHTLIQTISRVNRVYKGKNCGLIVDYIGIKSNLDAAITQYSGRKKQQFDGVDKALKKLRDLLRALGELFHGFDNTKYFTGTPLERLTCLNDAVEFIQSTDKLESTFMDGVKLLKSAYDLCSASNSITDEERDYVYFYVAIRSILFKITKGEAPDATEMTHKVRELVKEALISSGVEKIINVEDNEEIFSLINPDKLRLISDMPASNNKIKILQRLLEEEIGKYKKVNKTKAIDFSKKLRDIVDAYNNRQADISMLNDVIEELLKLNEELQKDANSFKELGIDYKEKAFYDILESLSKKYDFEYPQEKLLSLAKSIKMSVETYASYIDWENRQDIRAGMIIDIVKILKSEGYPPKAQTEAYQEIIEQAENFKKNNIDA